MDRIDALTEAMAVVRDADLTSLTDDADILTNPEAGSVWHVEL